MKSGIRILRMSPIGFQPIASALKALKLIGWKPMPPPTATCLKNAAQKDRREAGEVRGREGGNRRRVPPLQMGRYKVA
ncbi:MAG: hypothetical protein KDB68_17055 [Planctomycetes bacterium]|nr:hypothetical protein [Planctomycetota bacterium]